MQSTNSEYGSPYLAISRVLSFSFLSLCIWCNAMCLCCLRLKNTLFSTNCTLMLLLYAPQAWDWNVTPLTILWCHVRHEDTKTIKPIINKAFVASSGDMITDYNDLYYGGHWMLESDWLTNVLRCIIIFRETHGERSSRQLSWLHYMTISLRQMISVISKV